jgi:hypothetical protein
MVSMYDQTFKRIDEVQVGDFVYNHDKTSFAIVQFVEKVSATHWDTLYTPTKKYKPFATCNHPLYINGILSAVNVVDGYCDYHWLGKVGTIIPHKSVPSTDVPVYNLWVDHDNTYIVNGFGTTSIVSGGYILNSYKAGILNYNEVLYFVDAFAKYGSYAMHGANTLNNYIGKMNYRTTNKILARIIKSKIGFKCMIVASKIIGKCISITR